MEINEFLICKVMSLNQKSDSFSHVDVTSTGLLSPLAQTAIPISRNIPLRHV